MIGPTTDYQKQLITTAMPNFLQVVETTLLMTRQLANPVPKVLLFVVIGWAALLFSQPYSGLFRISPVGVDNLISVLGG